MGTTVPALLLLLLHSRVSFGVPGRPDEASISDRAGRSARGLSFYLGVEMCTIWVAESDDFRIDWPEVLLQVEDAIALM